MDRFEYYTTISKDDERLTSWESFNYIEVFNIYDQPSKTEKEQIRYGRTDKGLWLFVEPSRFSDHWDIEANGKVNESGTKEFEEAYQTYKRFLLREDKIKRILK